MFNFLLVIMTLLGFIKSEESFCVVEFHEITNCLYLNFEENLEMVTNATGTLRIHEATGSISKTNLGLLPKITKFEIFNSKIPHIESGALCTSFPNMVELNLSNIRFFPKITQDLFLHCENIERVEISRQILQNEAFISMPNVIELRLKNVTFSAGINKDTFKGLKSLGSLELSSISLVKISDDTFEHIKGLARLSLINNKIVKFSTTKPPFRDLKQLNRLIFAGIPMNNFTWGEFDGLNINLFDLELFDESCSDFDEKAFLQNIPKATSHLKSLYLNECHKSAEISSRLDERGVQVVWSRTFVNL